MTPIKTNPREHRATRTAIKQARITYKTQQPPCWLCGQPIDYETADIYDDNALEVDHMIPISKRPDLAADPDNLRPAHRGCNRNRNNQQPNTLNTSRDWENLR